MTWNAVYILWNMSYKLQYNCVVLLNIPTNDFLRVWFSASRWSKSFAESYVGKGRSTSSGRSSLSSKDSLFETSMVSILEFLSTWSKIASSVSRILASVAAIKMKMYSFMIHVQVIWPVYITGFQSLILEWKLPIEINISPKLLLVYVQLQLLCRRQ